jgi:hypothetical protein
MRFNRLGKGVTYKRGSMNRLESRYAAYLDGLKLGGDVLWYAYESVTFTLAKGTRYTPDFLVMLKDGTLEAHETKGFWQDAARIKIKVAAEKYPITFRAMKWVKGQWEMESFQ